MSNLVVIFFRERYIVFGLRLAINVFGSNANVFAYNSGPEINCSDCLDVFKMDRQVNNGCRNFLVIFVCKSESRRKADQQDCKDTEGKLLVHDALIDVGESRMQASHRHFQAESISTNHPSKRTRPRELP
jgi:hypothetical protein